MHDRRTSPRFRSGATARILLKDARAVTCEIVDRSEAGMRLRVYSVFGIPDVFEISLPDSQERVRAEVAWRRAGELGVSVVAQAQ